MSESVTELETLKAKYGTLFTLEVPKGEDENGEQ